MATFLEASMSNRRFMTDQWNDCECGCNDDRPGDWPGRPMRDLRDDWPGRPVKEFCMEGKGSPEFGFRRQFISRAEMLQSLNAYLEELENEAEGVREAIDELLDEMLECGDLDEDDLEDEEGCCCCGDSEEECEETEEK